MYQCLISERVLPLWAGPAGVFSLSGSCRTFSSPMSQKLRGGPPPGPSPAHETCVMSSVHVKNGIKTLQKP